MFVRVHISVFSIFRRGVFSGLLAGELAAALREQEKQLNS